jgi:hypothetical protein
MYLGSPWQWHKTEDHSQRGTCVSCANGAYDSRLAAYHHIPNVATISSLLASDQIGTCLMCDKQMTCIGPNLTIPNG